jgi:hypothetical protein
VAGIIESGEFVAMKAVLPARNEVNDDGGERDVQQKGEIARPKSLP